MADFRSARRFRAADYADKVRVIAVVTVITGVILLGLAACLLSYGAIHQVALSAGVSPRLARLYPLLLDAMLVVACVAALALRGASWWMQGYAWFSLLVVIAAVALAAATHAAGVSPPQRAMAAAVVAVPWALLLPGLGLWLLMLRYLRTVPAASSQRHIRPATEAAHSAGAPVPVEEPAAGFPCWDAESERPHAQPESPGAAPDTPDVRIIPAQREAPGPDAEPDTPEVRIIPAEADRDNSHTESRTHE
jgi:hypothetical protein